VTRLTRTFVVGARVKAVPVITASPFWLVQTQSSVTSAFSGFFSCTVTVAVMVSPMLTGWRKRRSWPR
jgi:hypothetical protein